MADLGITYKLTKAGFVRVRITVAHEGLSFDLTVDELERWSLQMARAALDARVTADRVGVALKHQQRLS
jgi:hypothetical protein